MNKSQEYHSLTECLVFSKNEFNYGVILLLEGFCKLLQTTAKLDDNKTDAIK